MVSSGQTRLVMTRHYDIVWGTRYVIRDPTQVIGSRVADVILARSMQGVRLDAVKMHVTCGICV